MVVFFKVLVEELATHPVALLDNVLETQETVFVMLTATFMAIAVKTLWKFVHYKVRIQYSGFC